MNVLPLRGLCTISESTGTRAGPPPPGPSGRGAAVRALAIAPGAIANARTAAPRPDGPGGGGPARVPVDSEIVHKPRRGKTFIARGVSPWDDSGYEKHVDLVQPRRGERLDGSSGG